MFYALAEETYKMEHMNWKEKIGLWVFRAAIMVYDAVQNCMYSRTPQYETIEWRSYNPSSGRTQDANFFHELDMTHEDSKDDILLHTVSRQIGPDTDIKTAVHWADTWRDPYTVWDLFDSPAAPWFFVGYMDGETTVDCTVEAERLIAYGNKVTPDVLRAIVPGSESNKWVYINPKTFEETDFPAEGILIGENVAQPTTESKKDD